MSETATGETGVTGRELRIVYAGLMLVLALGALDQSIVATALPRIVSDLGGLTRLSWVVTSYVLASTSSMPLYGKLSDQYGRKPLLYAAIIIFLLGSVLSGLSQSMTQLIIFRAIQGLGAGGLLPLAQITIGDLVSVRERGKYQGLFASIFAGSSVAGPVLGGVITDLWSWHWIFFINLPLGAIALGMIAVALKRPHKSRGQRIDYAGAVLLTVATTCLLLVLSLGGSQYDWLSLEVLGFAVVTIVTAVLFVVRERVAPEPIIPLRRFRVPVFVIACIVLALTFMAMMGSGVFFPVFFQLVLGVAPSNSGLLSGPFMAGIVISSMVGGRLVARWGRYKQIQVFGLGVATIGFLALATGALMGGGIWTVEPALVALGLGLGLVTPNMPIAVQNAVLREDLGVSTAPLAFFRSLGGVIGVAGSGTIMAAFLQRQIASMTPIAGLQPTTLLHGGMAQFASLSPEAHATVVAMYRHSIAMTFMADVAVAGLAFVIILFLPELPLKAYQRPGSGPGAAKE